MAVTSLSIYSDWKGVIELADMLHHFLDYLSQLSLVLAPVVLTYWLNHRQ